jgi:spermidine synthase
MVSLFYFISGATALILEVVWTKKLSYLIGVSYQAGATVVTAYMFGLGLGSLLATSRFLKRFNPVAVYGILQLAIGSFGFFSITLFSSTKPIFESLYNALFVHPSVFSIFRCLALFVLMAIPTTLMGMTLPLLATHFFREKESIESTGAKLYGLNTLGAVLGTFMASYILIPEFGLTKSSWLAGTLDIFLGLGVFLLKPERNHSVAIKKVRGPSTTRDLKSIMGPALLIIAISGCASMIFEVAWFRFLSDVFGSTTTAFACMLGIFLAGVALGSLVGSRLVKSFRLAYFPIAIFTTLLCGLSILTAMYFGMFPIWYGQLFRSLSEYSPSIGLFISQVIIGFLVVFPSTFLMGILFPFFVRAYRSTVTFDSNARVIGIPYFFNTAGNVMGTVLGGFVIVPIFGFTGAIHLAAFVCAISAALALFNEPSISRAVKVKSILGGIGVLLALVFLTPAPNHLLLNQSVFMSMRNPEKFESIVKMDYITYQTLLFQKEGLNMSVAVIGNEANDGSLGFRVAGKNEASTSLMGRRHLMLLGHLPVLFAKNPETVAVLGFGAGITAGAVLKHPEVKRMDIVEFEPAVLEASKYFTFTNGNPIADKRTHIILDDGRIMFSYGHSKYDVISVDPISPWVAGSSNLYSEDFYRVVSSRLNSGGIFCQWIQMGDFSEFTYKVILKSLVNSFRHVSIFLSTVDTVVLASNDPIQLDWSTFSHRFQQGDVKQDLHSNEIENPYQLLSFYYADTDQVHRYLEGHTLVNTDDNVWMESHLPLELYSYNQGFVSSALKQLIPGRYESLKKLVPGVPDYELVESLRTIYPQEFPELAVDIRRDLGVGDGLRSEEEISRRYKEELEYLEAAETRHDTKAAISSLEFLTRYKGRKGYYPLGLRLAKYLVQENKSTEALAMLDQLIKFHPAFPEAHLARVDNLAKLGKKELASEALKMGLFFNPENKELRDLAK